MIVYFSVYLRIGQRVTSDRGARMERAVPRAMLVGCCLHDLPVPRAPGTSDAVPFGGSAGGRSERSSQCEEHPYLDSTVDGSLCTPCVQRVKFTREAVRAQMLDLPIRVCAADQVSEWQWASLAHTHKQPAAVATNGHTIALESICAICAQEENGVLAPNAGKITCSSCELWFHACCLDRVGSKVGASGECPYCEFKDEIGDPRARERLRTPWESVQKKLARNVKKRTSTAIVVKKSTPEAEGRAAIKKAAGTSEASTSLMRPVGIDDESWTAYLAAVEQVGVERAWLPIPGDDTHPTSAPSHDSRASRKREGEELNGPEKKKKDRGAKVPVRVRPRLLCVGDLVEVEFGDHKWCAQPSTYSEPAIYLLLRPCSPT